MEHTYEWIKKAQKGDMKAKAILIEENRGLIWSIVQRFSGRAEQDDLFQIGTIGLLKCIEKFDFNYQVKFSTYAVPMILGEIRGYLRDDGMIKVSRSLKELSLRIRQTQDQYLKTENRELTISDLSKILNTDKDEIILAMESTQEVESIYKTTGDFHKETYLSDKSKAFSDNDKAIENIFLKEALNHLNMKERQIIFMRYFQDRTQNDVAKHIGISQVQVSRIEKKSLQQIRKYLE